MGDLVVAMERGWDGDADLARAILLLRRFKYDRAVPDFRLSSEDLDTEGCYALDILRGYGYVTVEQHDEDDLLGVNGSTAITTASGSQARIHLDKLAREHLWGRPKSLIATRKVLRRILVEGIYHERTLRMNYRSNETHIHAELPDRPWLQLAGIPLEPKVVLPELYYLAQHGLLYQGLAVRKNGGKKSTSEDFFEDYRLTKEGTDYVEGLGGDVSTLPSPEEIGSGYTRPGSGQLPSHTITTYNFHGSISNVHAGTGDINVGIDPATLGRFAEQLHAFTPSLTFSDDAGRAELTTTVEALRVETDKGRAAKLTQRIRELVSKASGPLKEIAIGVIDAELGKLSGN